MLDKVAKRFDFLLSKLEQGGTLNEREGEEFLQIKQEWNKLLSPDTAFGKAWLGFKVYPDFFNRSAKVKLLRITRDMIFWKQTGYRWKDWRYWLRQWIFPPRRG